MYFGLTGIKKTSEGEPKKRRKGPILELQSSDVGLCVSNDYLNCKKLWMAVFARAAADIISNFSITRKNDAICFLDSDFANTIASCCSLQDDFCSRLKSNSLDLQGKDIREVLYESYRVGFGSDNC